MTIRSANHDDLLSIASIHKAQFSTHFLGQYSPSLLQAFYLSFLGESVFLVHDGKNGVDGFILGGDGKRLAVVKAAFVRAHLMQCLWETLLRPQLWGQGVRRGLATMVIPSKWGVEPPDRPTFSLLSIAVAHDAFGKGVASRLVCTFEFAIQKHTKRYRLSVNSDNTRAIRFYEKMGFTLVKGDGQSLEFHKKLGKENDATDRQ
jgi:ribosomal protein S18 acetylase RimI-like enzyme